MNTDFEQSYAAVKNQVGIEYVLGIGFIVVTVLTIFVKWLRASKIGRFKVSVRS